MDEHEIIAKMESYTSWRHRIEVAPGIFTPGVRRPESKLRFLNLPEDLSGMSVLDLGAADGWFSFECERRGADRVVAVDMRPPTGFSIAAELLNSKVEYIQGSLYDLDLGAFDIVLCIDVLYHLVEPYTALKRLHAFCNKKLLLATISSDQRSPETSSTPALKFIRPQYPEDRTVHFAVSRRGLEMMLEDVGFEVERSELDKTDRIFVSAVTTSKT